MVILVKNESLHWKEITKLGGMTPLLLLWDASVKKYKEIRNDGIISAHAQSVALVRTHYLSKSLVQLPRNIEDSTIAHLTPYFDLFFTVQSILYRKNSENGQFLFCGHL